MGERVCNLTIDGVRLIKDLKVVDLRAALEERGLAKNGNKKELVQRLSIFEENRQKSSSGQPNPEAPNQWLENEADLNNDFLREYFKSQKALFQEHVQRQNQIGVCEPPRETPTTTPPSKEPHSKDVPIQSAHTIASAVLSTPSKPSSTFSKKKGKNAAVEPKSRQVTVTPKADPESSVQNLVSTRPSRSSAQASRVLSLVSFDDDDDSEGKKNLIPRSPETKSKRRGHTHGPRSGAHRRHTSISNLNSTFKPVPTVLEDKLNEAKDTQSYKVPSLKIKLPEPVPKTSTSIVSPVKESINSKLRYMQENELPRQIILSKRATKICLSPQNAEVSSSVQEESSPSINQIDSHADSTSNSNNSSGSNGSFSESENQFSSGEEKSDVESEVKPLYTFSTKKLNVKIPPKRLSHVGNKQWTSEEVVKKLNSLPLQAATEKVASTRKTKVGATRLCKRLEEEGGRETPSVCTASKRASKRSKSRKVKKLQLKEKKTTELSLASPLIPEHSSRRKKSVNVCSSGENVEASNESQFSIETKLKKDLLNLRLREEISPGKDISVLDLQLPQTAQDSSPIRRSSRLSKPKKSKKEYIKPPVVKKIPPPLLPIQDSKIISRKKSLQFETKSPTHPDFIESLKQQIEMPLHIEKFPLTDKSEVSSTSELTESPKSLGKVKEVPSNFQSFHSETPILDAHIAVEGHLDHAIAPDSGTIVSTTPSEKISSDSVKYSRANTPHFKENLTKDASNFKTSRLSQEPRSPPKKSGYLIENLIENISEKNKTNSTLNQKSSEPKNVKESFRASYPAISKKIDTPGFKSKHESELSIPQKFKRENDTKDLHHIPISKSLQCEIPSNDKLNIVKSKSVSLSEPETSSTASVSVSLSNVFDGNPKIRRPSYEKVKKEAFSDENVETFSNSQSKNVFDMPADTTPCKVDASLETEKSPNNNTIKNFKDILEEATLAADIDGDQDIDSTLFPEQNLITTKISTSVPFQPCTIFSKPSLTTTTTSDYQDFRTSTVESISTTKASLLVSHSEMKEPTQEDLEEPSKNKNSHGNSPSLSSEITSNYVSIEENIQEWDDRVIDKVDSDVDSISSLSLSEGMRTTSIQSSPSSAGKEIKLDNNKYMVVFPVGMNSDKLCSVLGAQNEVLSESDSFDQEIESEREIQEQILCRGKLSDESQENKLSLDQENSDHITIFESVKDTSRLNPIKDDVENDSPGGKTPSHGEENFMNREIMVEENIKTISKTGKSMKDVNCDKAEERKPVSISDKKSERKSMDQSDKLPRSRNEKIVKPGDSYSEFAPSNVESVCKNSKEKHDIDVATSDTSVKKGHLEADIKDEKKSPIVEGKKTVSLYPEGGKIPIKNSDGYEMYAPEQESKNVKLATGRERQELPPGEKTSVVLEKERSHDKCVNFDDSSTVEMEVEKGKEYSPFAEVSEENNESLEERLKNETISVKPAIGKEDTMGKALAVARAITSVERELPSNSLQVAAFTEEVKLKHSYNVCSLSEETTVKMPEVKNDKPFQPQTYSAASTCRSQEIKDVSLECSLKMKETPICSLEVEDSTTAKPLELIEISNVKSLPEMEPAINPIEREPPSLRLEEICKNTAGKPLEVKENATFDLGKGKHIISINPCEKKEASAVTEVGIREPIVEKPVKVKGSTLSQQIGVKACTSVKPVKLEEISENLWHKKDATKKPTKMKDTSLIPTEVKEMSYEKPVEAKSLVSSNLVEVEKATLHARNSSAIVNVKGHITTVDAISPTTTVDVEDSTTAGDVKDSNSTDNVNDPTTSVDKTDSATSVDASDPTAAVNVKDSTTTVDAINLPSTVDVKYSKIITVGTKDLYSTIDERDPTTAVDAKIPTTVVAIRESTTLDVRDYTTTIDQNDHTTVNINDSTTSVDAKNPITTVGVKESAASVDVKDSISTVHTRSSSTTVDAKDFTKPVDSRSSANTGDVKDSTAAADARSPITTVNVKDSVSTVDAGNPSSPVDMKYSTATVDAKSSFSAVEVKDSTAPDNARSPITTVEKDSASTVEARSHIMTVVELDSAATVDAKSLITPVDVKDTTATVEAKIPITKVDKKGSAATIDARSPISTVYMKKSAATVEARRPITTFDEEGFAAAVEPQSTISFIDVKDSTSTVYAKSPISTVEKNSGISVEAKSPVTMLDEKDSAATIVARSLITTVDVKDSTTTVEARGPISTVEKKDSAAAVDGRNPISTVDVIDSTASFDATSPVTNVDVKESATTVEAKSLNATVDMRDSTATVEATSPITTVGKKNSAATVDGRNPISIVNVKESTASFDGTSPVTTVDVKDSTATVEARSPITRVNVKESTATVETRNPINTVHMQNSTATVDVKDAMATVEAVSPITMVDVKDFMATVEARSPITMVDVKDSTATLEARSPITMVDVKDSTATLEARSPISTVDVKDSTAVVETRSPIIMVDVKDSIATVGAKSPITTVDVKDSTATLEARSPINMVDVKDSTATLEARSPITTVDVKDSTATPEARSPISTVDVKDSTSTLEVRSPITTVDVKDSTATPEARSPISTVDVKDSTTIVETRSPITMVDVKDSVATVGAKSPITTVDVKDSTATVEARGPITMVDVKDSTATLEARSPITMVDVKDSTSTLEARSPISTVDVKDSTTIVETRSLITMVDVKDSIATVEARSPITMVDVKDSTSTLEARSPITTVDVKDSTATVEARSPITTVDMKDSTATLEVRSPITTVDVKDSTAPVEARSPITMVDVKDSTATLEARSPITTVDVKDSTSTLEVRSPITTVDVKDSTATLEARSPITTVDMKDSTATLEARSPITMVDVKDSTATLEARSPISTVDVKDSTTIVEARSPITMVDVKDSTATLEARSPISTVVEDSTTIVEARSPITTVVKNSMATVEARSRITTVDMKDSMATIETRPITTVEKENSTVNVVGRNSISTVDVKESTVSFDATSPVTNVDMKDFATTVDLRSPIPTVDVKDAAATVEAKSPFTTVDMKESMATVETRNPITTVHMQNSTATVDVKDTMATVEAGSPITTVDVKNFMATVETRSPITTVDMKDSTATVEARSPITTVDMKDSTATLEARSPITTVDVKDSTATLEARSPISTVVKDSTTIVEARSPITTVDMKDSTATLEARSPISTVDVKDSTTIVEAKSPITKVDVKNSTATVEARSPITTVVKDSTATVEAKSPLTTVDVKDSTATLEARSPISTVDVKDSTTIVEAKSPITKVDVKNSTATVEARSPITIVVKDSTATVEAKSLLTTVDVKDSTATLEARSPISTVDVKDSTTIVEARSPITMVDMKDSTATLEARSPITTVVKDSTATVEAKSPLTTVDVKDSTATLEARSPISMVDVKDSTTIVEAKSPTTKIDVKDCTATVEARIPITTVDVKDSTATVEARSPITTVEKKISAATVGGRNPISNVDVKGSTASFDAISPVTNATTDVATVEARSPITMVDVKDSTATVDVKDPTAIIDVKNSAATVEVKHLITAVGVKDSTATVGARSPITSVDVKNSAAVVDSSSPISTLDVKDPIATVGERSPSTTVDMKDSFATVEGDPAITVDLKYLSTNVGLKDDFTTVIDVKDSTTSLSMSDPTFDITDSATSIDKKDPTPTVTVTDSTTPVVEAESTTTVDVAKHDCTTVLDIKDSTTTVDITDSTTAVDVRNSNTMVDVRNLSNTVNAKYSSIAIGVKDHSCTIGTEDSCSTVYIKDSTTDFVVKGSTSAVGVNDPSSATDLTDSASTVGEREPNIGLPLVVESESTFFTTVDAKGPATEEPTVVVCSLNKFELENSNIQKLDKTESISMKTIEMGEALKNKPKPEVAKSLDKFLTVKESTTEKVRDAKSSTLKTSVLRKPAILKEINKIETMKTEDVRHSLSTMPFSGYESTTFKSIEVKESMKDESTDVQSLSTIEDSTGTSEIRKDHFKEPLKINTVISVHPFKERESTSLKSKETTEYTSINPTKNKEISCIKTFNLNKSVPENPVVTKSIVAPIAVNDSTPLMPLNEKKEKSVELFDATEPNELSGKHTFSKMKDKAYESVRSALQMETIIRSDDIKCSTSEKINVKEVSLFESDSKPNSAKTIKAKGLDTFKPLKVEESTFLSAIKVKDKTTVNQPEEQMVASKDVAKESSSIAVELKESASNILLKISEPMSKKKTEIQESRMKPLERKEFTSKLMEDKVTSSKLVELEETPNNQIIEMNIVTPLNLKESFLETTGVKEPTLLKTIKTSEETTAEPLDVEGTSENPSSAEEPSCTKPLEIGERVPLKHLKNENPVKEKEVTSQKLHDVKDFTKEMELVMGSSFKSMKDEKTTVKSLNISKPVSRKLVDNQETSVKSPITNKSTTKEEVKVEADILKPVEANAFNINEPTSAVALVTNETPAKLSLENKDITTKVSEVKDLHVKSLEVNSVFVTGKLLDEKESTFENQVQREDSTSLSSVEDKEINIKSLSQIQSASEIPVVVQSTVSLPIDFKRSTSCVSMKADKASGLKPFCGINNTLVSTEPGESTLHKPVLVEEFTSKKTEQVRESIIVNPLELKKPTAIKSLKKNEVPTMTAEEINPINLKSLKTNEANTSKSFEVKEASSSECSELKEATFVKPCGTELLTTENPVKPNESILKAIDIKNLDTLKPLEKEEISKLEPIEIKNPSFMNPVQSEETMKLVGNAGPSEKNLSREISNGKEINSNLAEKSMSLEKQGLLGCTLPESETSTFYSSSLIPEKSKSTISYLNEQCDLNNTDSVSTSSDNIQEVQIKFGDVDSLQLKEDFTASDKNIFQKPSPSISLKNVPLQENSDSQMKGASTHSLKQTINTTDSIGNETKDKPNNAVVVISKSTDDESQSDVLNDKNICEKISSESSLSSDRLDLDATFSDSTISDIKKVPSSTVHGVINIATIPLPLCKASTVSERHLKLPSVDRRTPEYVKNDKSKPHEDKPQSFTSEGLGEDINIFDSSLKKLSSINNSASKMTTQIDLNKEKKSFDSGKKRNLITEDESVLPVQDQTAETLHETKMNTPGTAKDVSNLKRVDPLQTCDTVLSPSLKSDPLVERISDSSVKEDASSNSPDNLKIKGLTTSHAVRKVTSSLAKVSTQPLVSEAASNDKEKHSTVSSTKEITSFVTKSIPLPSDESVITCNADGNTVLFVSTKKGITMKETSISADKESCTSNAGRTYLDISTTKIPETHSVDNGACKEIMNMGNPVPSPVFLESELKDSVQSEQKGKFCSRDGKISTTVISPVNILLKREEDTKETDTLKEISSEQILNISLESEGTETFPINKENEFPHDKLISVEKTPVNESPMKLSNENRKTIKTSKSLSKQESCGNSKFIDKYEKKKIPLPEDTQKHLEVESQVHVHEIGVDKHSPQKGTNDLPKVDSSPSKSTSSHENPVLEKANTLTKFSIKEDVNLSHENQSKESRFTNIAKPSIKGSGFHDSDFGAMESIEKISDNGSSKGVFKSMNNSKQVGNSSSTRSDGIQVEPLVYPHIVNLNEIQLPSESVSSIRESVTPSTCRIETSTLSKDKENVKGSALESKKNNRDISTISTLDVTKRKLESFKENPTSLGKINFSFKDKEVVKEDKPKFPPKINFPLLSHSQSNEESSSPKKVKLDSGNSFRKQFLNVPLPCYSKEPAESTQGKCLARNMHDSGKEGLSPEVKEPQKTPEVDQTPRSKQVAKISSELKQHFTDKGFALDLSSIPLPPNKSPLTFLKETKVRDTNASSGSLTSFLGAFEENSNLFQVNQMARRKKEESGAEATAQSTEDKNGDLREKFDNVGVTTRQRSRSRSMEKDAVAAAEADRKPPKTRRRSRSQTKEIEEEQDGNTKVATEEPERNGSNENEQKKLDVIKEEKEGQTDSPVKGNNEAERAPHETPEQDTESTTNQEKKAEDSSKAEHKVETKKEDKLNRSKSESDRRSPDKSRKRHEESSRRNSRTSEPSKHSSRDKSRSSWKKRSSRSSSSSPHRKRGGSRSSSSSSRSSSRRKSSGRRSSRKSSRRSSSKRSRSSEKKSSRDKESEKEKETPRDSRKRSSPKKETLKDKKTASDKELPEDSMKTPLKNESPNEKSPAPEETPDKKESPEKDEPIIAIPAPGEIEKEDPIIPIPAAEEIEKELAEEEKEDTTPSVTTFRSARKVSLSRSKSGEEEKEKPKKRKWGSSSSTKPSLEISSFSLKSLMPDVKPLSPSELTLQLESEKESEESEGENQTKKLKEEEKEESKEKRDENVDKPQVDGENNIDAEEEDHRPNISPSKKRRSLSRERVRKRRGEREERGSVRTSSPPHKRHSLSTTDRRASFKGSPPRSRNFRIVEAGPSTSVKLSIPPARNPISNVILLQNLVRPFTIKQLKDLLQRTGKLKENGFWIDSIKSKCLAMYENEDQAQETRMALHGVKWPTINPKNLFVDYSTEDELKKKLSELAFTQPLSHQEEPRREKRRFDGPVREWDLAKLGERSPGEREREKERLRREREEERIREREKMLKAQSPKEEKTEKSAPVKSLDDLFNKTKAQPSIYWLPLTLAQIAEKEAQRRKRIVLAERHYAELKAEQEKQRAEREKEREKELEKRRQKMKEREKERNFRRSRSRSRRRSRSRSNRRSPRRSPRRSRRSGSRDNRKSHRRSKSHSRSSSRSRS